MATTQLKIEIDWDNRTYEVVEVHEQPVDVDTEPTDAVEDPTIEVGDENVPDHIKWFGKPHEESKVFYVAEDGNDSNSGLSEDAPIASLAKTRSLIKSGRGDRVLLKAGHEWDTTLDLLPTGAEGRVGVITRYGYGGHVNPTISGLHHGKTSVVDTTLLVRGLNIAPLTPGRGVGVQLLGGYTYMRLEDVTVCQYAVNINSHPYYGQTQDSILLRNCNILDAYNLSGRSQGMYIDNVVYVNLSGCIFDHNGWGPGALGTVFNHGLYVDNLVKDIDVVNSVFMRSASHGVQLRSGGLVRNCMFLQNPIGVMLGGGNPTDSVYISFLKNSILWGTDIQDGGPRGWAIDFAGRDYRREGVTFIPHFKDGSSIKDNVIAHCLQTPYPEAYADLPQGGMPRAVGENHIHRWAGNEISNPTRDVFGSDDYRTDLLDGLRSGRYSIAEKNKEILSTFGVSS